MIYLDNAATTLYKPDKVIDAVVNAMKTQGNASRGAHGVTLTASRAVYDARVKIAKFFNFDKPSNVIFTCNSTEALNIAINGTIKTGDKVISTDTEHNSVLRPLYHLQKEKNIDLQFIPADVKGVLSIEDAKKIIDDKTKVVVINHISNLTGNVNDIKTISKITHDVNAILIVDGSQSAGTMPVDVNDLGIDIYCFTGHKGLFGPQGTGGLLVKEGIEVSAFKRGGSGVKTYEEEQPSDYPTRLEAGTLNSHGIAGLSAAIDFLNEIGVENIQKKERELTEYFYNEVTKIDGIKVYGNFNSRGSCNSPVQCRGSCNSPVQCRGSCNSPVQCRGSCNSTVQCRGEHCEPIEHAAIVSLNVKDYDSGEVSDALSNDYGIATRPGAHCAPRLHIALGTKQQGAVRFSFSYFTTKEELDVAINALKEIAS